MVLFVLSSFGTIFDWLSMKSLSRSIHPYPAVWSRRRQSVVMSWWIYGTWLYFICTLRCHVVMPLNICLNCTHSADKFKFFFSSFCLHMFLTVANLLYHICCVSFWDLYLPNMRSVQYLVETKWKTERCIFAKSFIKMRLSNLILQANWFSPEWNVTTFFLWSTTPASACVCSLFCIFDSNIHILVYFQRVGN